MSVVTCQNVSKQFGSNSVLKDLNVTIQENSITGLIGRNGAGKTTLLQMLAGMLAPTSGNIRVFEENPIDNLKVSANTIFVDDDLVFSPEMKLYEILSSAEMFYDNWDSEFANRLIRYFGFQTGVFHDNLSKGKASTFNAILGLAARTPLTIFDEPTTGMDYSVRQDFYRALLKDYMNHPRTIIISSHLLNELESILEDIMIIKDGTCIVHEPMEDFKTYAIALSGDYEKIEKVVNESRIIHRRFISSNHAYVVVKELSGSEQDCLKQLGVTQTSVEPAELSMYLTNETKGGIDDVFKQS
ncbi:ATP-binding cassette domain-containing protein [Aquisalibacillus elongatus]|uniref:ABC-2 type transport system ATP-binding protein n=1 Tax=Aquisalibacillus elongatus TaxID=485577 RepID=A0A3N5BDG2_9BACI|nr:ABC transporter ATP-binding protein [Aquisalibacillus elongatus]RPF53380.1 ABC-2 type transport system ATP-binding protein [Aquisalibacillus elongatus]